MTTKDLPVIEAAKAVRYILDTDTPDHDNRRLEVRIAQAVIDCVSSKQEPFGYVLDDGSFWFRSEDGIPHDATPLYTHPAPDLVAEKDAEIIALRHEVEALSEINYDTVHALIAAAYRAAADVCADEADCCPNVVQKVALDGAYIRINKLTPADAQAKLRELIEQAFDAGVMEAITQDDVRNGKWYADEVLK